MPDPTLGLMAVQAPQAGDWVKIGVVVLLLLFAGYMAAAEVALTRMSLLRALALKDEGRKGSRRMVGMLQDPARYLNTILLALLVCANASAVLSATVAEKVFGRLALTIATIVVTLLLFIFSEVIPKTYALQHTERVAFLTFPTIRVMTAFLRPVSKFLIRFSNWISPGIGMKEGPLASEAEIRQLIEIAGDQASIEDQERQMIHSVFEFNDTVVREVMVPRPDMVAVERETPLNEVLDTVVEHGYSRIPMFREDVDHVEGIVYAKDILERVHRHGAGGTAADLGRPAEFVPETKLISQLLREMQQKKFHMAIVFDEYGAVAGLVTLEDLIEEIVGEIVDEYDTEDPQVVVIDEATLRVNGRLPIDEVNELLQTSLPEGEWDTVAGLVVGLLGRAPEPDETVQCDGVRFVAEQVEGHRVLRVRIEKLPADEEPAAVAPLS